VSGKISTYARSITSATRLPSASQGSELLHSDHAARCWVIIPPRWRFRQALLVLIGLNDRLRSSLHTLRVHSSLLDIPICHSFIQCGLNLCLAFFAFVLNEVIVR